MRIEFAFQGSLCVECSQRSGRPLAGDRLHTGHYARPLRRVQHLMEKVPSDLNQRCRHRNSYNMLRTVHTGGYHYTYPHHPLPALATKAIAPATESLRRISRSSGPPSEAEDELSRRGDRAGPCQRSHTFCYCTDSLGVSRPPPGQGAVLWTPVDQLVAPPVSERLGAACRARSRRDLLKDQGRVKLCHDLTEPPSSRVLGDSAGRTTSRWHPLIKN